MDNGNECRFFIKRSYRLAACVVALGLLVISIGVDDCSLYVKIAPLLFAAAVAGILAMSACAIPYVSINENELIIYLPLKRKSLFLDNITGFTVQKNVLTFETTTTDERAAIWLSLLAGANRDALLAKLREIAPLDTPKLEDSNGE